jgi:hypothetical protein
VAGDEDRDRVAAHRPADLAGGRAAPDHRRECAVGGGAAVGDLGQQVPDATLERVAPAGCDRDRERAALAGEVFLDLAQHAVEAVVDHGAERGPGRRVPMRGEVEAGDRVAGAGDGQVAERGDGDRVAGLVRWHAPETVAPAGP